MSDGEVARFVRKFKKIHDGQENIRRSPRQNAKKMEQFNAKIKCKKQQERRVSKWTLRLSASSVGEKGITPPNIPQRKNEESHASHLE